MSDISVGSVAVDIVPDTRTFAAKLKAKMQGVSVDVKVNPDDAEYRTKIAELTRERTANIRATTSTATAEAKLDELARDRTVNIDANGGRGLSGMTQGIIALAPLIGPLTAGLVGLTVALTAPLAVAGAGVGLFALLTGVAVKQTEKQSKAIDQLAKKVTSAQLALSKASTPAGRKSAQEQLTAATQDYKAALDALSPSQRRFIVEQGNLSASFEKLLHTNGEAIFAPIVAGMQSLEAVMPRLGPIITPVSRAIQGLILDVTQAVKSPGFTTFASSFGAAAGTNITVYGHIFGNFAKGLIGLLRQFGPLAGEFTASLARMASSFATFGANAGSNSGVQQFVNYLRTEGPKVAQALGEVAGAIGHIVVALAPLGGVELAVITKFAEAINAIPTSTLTAVAVAVAALMLSLKGYRAIDSATTSLAKFGTQLSSLRTQGELTKTQGAIRGLAGAGGLGLLATSATSSNKALGLLGSAAGGALIGFEVGGPIGAGIGAVGGALLHLALGAHKAHTSVQPLKADFSGLLSTLNQITGATTAATRAMVLEQLTRSGALKVLNQYGISSRQAAFAIANGGPARDKLIANLKSQQANLLTSTRYQKQYLDSLDPGTTNAKVYQQAKRDYESTKRVNDEKLRGIRTALASVGVVNADAAAIRNRTRDTTDYAGKLKGLPKAAKTEIKAEGILPTTKAILDLTQKYHLTPKQVTTLIRASGADVATSKVLALQRAITALHDKQVNLSVNLTRHYSGGAGKASAQIGGARATGGPVVGGVDYLVGETGPEILRMGGSGHVYPNGVIPAAPAPVASGSSSGPMRLVVGDYEFDAYLESVADDRIAAASGLSAQSTRAGAR